MVKSKLKKKVIPKRPRDDRGQKIGGTKFGKNEKERLGKMSRRSHATVFKLTATNDVCI